MKIFEVNVFEVFVLEVGLTPLIVFVCLGVFRLYQPFFCLRGGRESADGTEGCCSVIREVRYKLFFTHICPTFECNFTHCIKKLENRHGFERIEVLTDLCTIYESSVLPPVWSW